MTVGGRDVEGFGLRGLPEQIGWLVMDSYIIYAWVMFAVMLFLAYVVYLFGPTRKSVRASRAFRLLLGIGVIMMFATPTGNYM